MNIEMAETTQKFSGPENPALVSLQGMDVMGPVISRLKQKAHDFGVSQRPDGRDLSPSEVGHLVGKRGSFFVGEKETGEKFIFGIPVPLRSRDGSPVSAGVLVARDKAMRDGFLKAVINAERYGQIDRLTAAKETQKVLAWTSPVWQSGSPIDAQFGLGLRDRPDTTDKKTKARAYAAATALVTANTAVSEHRKGSKVIRGLFVAGSIIAIGMTACSPIIEVSQGAPSTKSREVETQAPEQANLEIKKAFLALYPEYAENKDLTPVTFAVPLMGSKEKQPYNFVAMMATEEQKANAGVTVYDIGGKKVAMEENAIIFAQQENLDWVKLEGRPALNDKGGLSTEWYAGENKVLQFDPDKPNLVGFWALTGNPSKLVGPDGLTMWDGKSPYILSVASAKLPESVGKALLAPVAFKAPEPTATPEPEKAPTMDMVTEVGFSPDEVELVKNSAGLWVVVEKGADPNIADNVDARWNPELKALEWKWGPELENHLLNIARLGPTKNGEIIYEEEHMKKIDNLLRNELTFTIRKDGDRDKYTWVWFINGEGSPDKWSGFPLFGTIVIERPSEDVGELLKIHVVDFKNPIKGQN